LFNPTLLAVANFSNIHFSVGFVKGFLFFRVDGGGNGEHVGGQPSPKTRRRVLAMADKQKAPTDTGVPAEALAKAGGVASIQLNS